MNARRCTSSLCAALVAAFLCGAPAVAGPLRFRPVAERMFPEERANAAPRGLRRSEASRGAIGSPNTVTADPPIPRPRTTPCIVSLFTGVQFADFTPKTFAYAPPPACPGPWQKVVLAADFAVSAGRQFDRTAQISIGNTNVFYGTTAEPSRTVAPTWHIERDLTDDAALFATAHPGEADLGNLVNATYTSVISGTAYLQFYPLADRRAAPRTPDIVLSVPNVTGGAQALPTTASTLSQTYAFPTNVERAYLDVIAQSQSQDEFWYTCVPSDLAAALNSCPSTAFRETEVTIDGKPAGVAPVYPWIYTGGIDPYLWRPIPGVQALNFVPYRVDLTPFAAILSDGSRQHTVAIGVYSATSYFLATSTLLLYLDRGSKQVTGALTRDTLAAAPTPRVSEKITTTGGFSNGTVSVASRRDYAIEGYATTSRGRIVSTVAGSIEFSNDQRFVNAATVSNQDITQATTVYQRSASVGAGTPRQDIAVFSYPLRANIDVTINADGSLAQKTTIDQRYLRAIAHDNGKSFFELVRNEVAPADTLDFDASFRVTGHTGQTSSQRYATFDSNGTCYVQAIAAADGLLTNVTNGRCNRDEAQGVLREALAGRVVR